MTGNTFGRVFRITTSGESYAGAFRKDENIPKHLYGGLAIIIDGVPAGLLITQDIIQSELEKRRPGKSKLDTKRKEKDKVYIFSGVMKDNISTGAPVGMIIPNNDIEEHQIKKHEKLGARMRPGQGAYTYFKKYGQYADVYGAGRASGRETAARVAGGAIAKIILDRIGVDVIAYTTQISDIKAKELDYDTIKKNYMKNDINCPDLSIASKMEKKILDAIKEGESVGGVIELVVKNTPAGLGEPVFDKLDALISHGIMSIGAVKGIEFGSGFRSAQMDGSQSNDIQILKDERVEFKSNNAGGILGGISTGQEIRARIAVKPTPTILKKQKAVNIKKMENENISFSTRNDPCICTRIYPVIEAMTRMVLVDALMINNGYQSMQEIEKKWRKL